VARHTSKGHKDGMDRLTSLNCLRLPKHDRCHIAEHENGQLRTQVSNRNEQPRALTKREIQGVEEDNHVSAGSRMSMQCFYLHLDHINKKR